ncbi:MAG TPA: SIMPL domain-containing protein [Syntrophobacteraceae bacterium]|nr:SIMPL domain-containing protein [Syntrophobacteraceae bacterium]
MPTDRNSSILLALGIFLGLVIGAAILGRSLAEIRKSERYVTVKGFAERDVKADLAVWPIKVKTAGNDLSEVSQSSEQTRKKVVQFLIEKGFKPEEIVNQYLAVTDRQAAFYGPMGKDGLRYVADATIILRSNDVDRVQQVSQMTDELISAGMVISESRGYEGLNYMFTQLSAIKPEMMAEATKNARAAANQFAQDSGSKIGAIRKARQGLFSINDRDRAAGQAEGGGHYYYQPSSDINKRVRVVLTIDYFLEH